MSFTCALLSDGTVRCWGQNTDGRLGDGTTDSRTAPVTVSGLSGVTSIAAGADHACAVTSGGTVKCWGDNWYGTVGDGTTRNNRLSPVAVSEISGAAALTAGPWYSCALLSSGTVKCWGKNWQGKLGDGTTEDRLTPVAVSGLSRAAGVTAGQDHVCALLSDATVSCWGDNWYGQLGDGTSEDRRTPVSVIGLE